MRGKGERVVRKVRKERTKDRKVIRSKESKVRVKIVRLLKMESIDE